MAHALLLLERPLEQLISFLDLGLGFSDVVTRILLLFCQRYLRQRVERSIAEALLGVEHEFAARLLLEHLCLLVDDAQNLLHFAGLTILQLHTLGGCLLHSAHLLVVESCGAGRALDLREASPLLRPSHRIVGA